MAIDMDLEVVGAVNKIDLPGAEPERVKQEMEDVLGLDGEDILPVSAKTGSGVIDLLEAIVERIPPPGGDPQCALSSLIFDSYFDPTGVLSVMFG